MNKSDYCLYCKSTELKSFATATYWQTIKLNYVECQQCGLIFTNPMPSLEVVYEGNRALNILHTSRGTFAQYKGGKEYVYTLNKTKENGVMLDIGCAEGFFLKGIEENSGWSAEGLEIIKSVVDFANNVLNVKVIEGTLETIEDRDDYYDHLRMNNVIEHIQNPVIFLNKAYSILKKGGTIYCSTPNGVQDGAILKVANKRGFEINLLENHFLYYPPKTLRNIFKSCGFEIIYSYSEDISNTLKDFGITPGIKKPDNDKKYNLDFYKDKSNTDFNVNIEEISSYKNHPSLKKWKLLLAKYINEIFRLRLPYFLPIGHQQHIYAKKI